MKTRIIAAALAIIAILAVIFAMPKKISFSLTGELGTTSNITIYGKNSTARRLEEYIKTSDTRLSLTKPQSELSRLNGGEATELSPDTAELLALAVQYTAEYSFNPFAGALFELWGSAILTEALPEDEDIQNAQAASFPVSLEITDFTAQLSNPAQQVNLGAIAKGYITDKLVKMLKEDNVKSALINLGGNIYAHGRKPDGNAWQVAVRSPDSPDEYLGIISAENAAIVTSGDYERYFVANGKRYHHITDPKSGYPAESGLRSVTIISENATLADMLSTKCFVLGLEESKPVIEEYSVQAIFVTDNNEVYYSEGISGKFDNPDYIYYAF